jgi:hypothetical protein
MAVSRPLTACAWCGLLSEAGPVCTICGSPALDITGRTTVLDVTWRMEPPAPARTLDVGHQWVSLGHVSDLFRIPEPDLRSWLEEAPESEEPRLLLIEPGIQTRPTAIWAPRDAARSPLRDSLPPPMSHPQASEEAARMAEADPLGPSLWIAPMPAPQPFRLEAAWAFQPTVRERRLIRLEMLRTRGATILAVGLGAGGAIYVLDRALR